MIKMKSANFFIFDRDNVTEQDENILSDDIIYKNNTEFHKIIEYDKQYNVFSALLEINENFFKFNYFVSGGQDETVNIRNIFYYSPETNDCFMYRIFPYFNSMNKDTIMQKLRITLYDLHHSLFVCVTDINKYSLFDKLNDKTNALFLKKYNASQNADTSDFKWFVINHPTISQTQLAVINVKLAYYGIKNYNIVYNYALKNYCIRFKSNTEAAMFVFYFSDYIRKNENT